MKNYWKITWKQCFEGINKFLQPKVKNYQEFVRDSNLSLKLLTFQLSNARELETIKYAFGL